MTDPSDLSAGTNRVEAFSDGVIAVAITLLVLDLHVPDPDSTAPLTQALAGQWPSYAAYAISFLTVGILWMNHHDMLRRLMSVDRSVLILNLLLLMCIVVVPFTTALMATYIVAGEERHLAAVVYGTSFLVVSLVFLGTQRYVLVSRSNLLHAHVSPGVRRSALRRSALGVVPYALATAAGLLSPYLTLGICGLVAVFYAYTRSNP